MKRAAVVLGVVSVLWLGQSGIGCSDETDACEGAECGAGGVGGGLVLECPPSGVLYGPWSLHIDETSAVVRWDNCAQNAPELSFESEAGGAAQTVTGEQEAFEVTTEFVPLIDIPPDVAGTYYRSHVELTGLEPGTCYRYELSADPTRTGRVCTARAAGESFRFLAIGDTNPGLGDTAGVFEHTLSLDPDFTIHMGDIQYYASIVESWASWFPQMAPLLEQGALLPCPGNHEYEQETEFADYYERLFVPAGFDGTADYYRFQSGGVWFFSVNAEIDFGEGSVQGDWLEQQLADAASQPGYRAGIVYFHRPMYTLANYSQQGAERDHFEPLFLQHGVKLVMAGHVHGYERFVDGELTYITTGGGGAALHDLDVHIDDRPEVAALRVASAKRYHAMVFDVGATELSAQVISNDGEILDEFAIPIGP